MKRWSGILLLFFAALLWGCGGGHDARVTAELDRADSLLRTSDTAAHAAALRQMVALDTARALQSDEALRARHALLLVQARYKCYVTEPADSALIDSALSYYADHHGSAADHERYTRALIYSGAVAEELGHPQQAMQYYLEAESTADPNDHFNLGYIRMHIAALLQDQRGASEEAIDYYKSALQEFKKTTNYNYQIICGKELGALYKLHNIDSSYYYIAITDSLARQYGTDYDRYSIKVILSGFYFKQKKYHECVSSISDYVREKGSLAEETLPYSLAAQSYAKLGMTDSARLVIFNCPSPFTRDDSINVLLMLAETAKAEKDYPRYTALNDSAELKAEMLMESSESTKLVHMQQDFERLEQELHVSQLRNRNSFLVILLLSSLLLALLVTFLWHRVNASHKIERERLIAELEKIQTQLDASQQLLVEAQSHIDSPDEMFTESKEQLQLNRQMLNNLQSNVDNKLIITHEILDKIRLKNRRTGLKHLLKEYSSQLSITDFDDELWQKLKNYADVQYDNLTERWQSEYPSLTEEDFKFIYLCCIDAPNVVIMLCMQYTSIHTVSNNKMRIPSEKMHIDCNLDKLLKIELERMNKSEK